MFKYEEPIETYFEKKFVFDKQLPKVLPLTNMLYKSDIWSLPSMEQMKSELNEIKSLLNDKDDLWHEHTFHINKAGFVMDYIRSLINPELLTQAWCKFYEILSNYSLISLEAENLTSLHLCEAPGAFISALNHYLFTNCPIIYWQWVANTLNPYYEGHNIKNVVVDDRLIFPTLKNWYFGKEDTGDIIDLEYLKDLLIFLEEKNPISLITADGSMNCLENPDEQEIITSELQFKEMLIALHCLSAKGNFVLKQFTSFECVTICKIYLLNCLFEEVHMFKPFTSRPSNSEVYIVCLRYLGLHNFKEYLFKIFEEYVSGSNINKALFPLSSIPDSFITQIISCSKYFMSYQKEAIEENLKMFSTKKSNYEEQLNSLKHLCAEHYVNKCGIVSNDDYSSAHLFSRKKQIKSSFFDKENRNCKQLYFKAVGETYNNLTKYKSLCWEEKVLDVDKRLNECFPISYKRSRVNLEWITVWKDIIQRMKCKSFENWFLIGKKVKTIENSKFCNPMLIYLWNKISYCNQICYSDLVSKYCISWDVGEIEIFLKESRDQELLIISVWDSKSSVNDDPLWLHLTKAFNNSLSFHVPFDTKQGNIQSQKKIFYVNTTCWIQSLHQETIIKNRLVNIICNIMKVLNKGDFLIICIQSLLMRFTVGLFFILLSLFEKFICLLPNSMASSSGQLWMLKNFQKPEWTEKITAHLENLLKFDMPESKEVLQIVPIFSLCSGSFYEYILFLNNDHMLQRMRNLISCEKRKIK